MKFCHNCGAQLADDALFCAACGTRMEPQVNAQQPNPADNQYGYQQAPNYGYQQAPQQGYQQAPNYGYQQAPQQGYQQPPQQGYQQAPNYGYQQPPQQGYQQAPNYGYQQPPQQPAPKKKKGGGLKTLISLVLVFAIIFGALAIFVPGVISPNMVAKRAVKAVFNGDIDKAAKYFVDESSAKSGLKWYAEATKDCTNVKLKIGEVEDATEAELVWISAGVQLMGGSEVKKAKSVEVIVTYTYEGETETESIYVVLVKQGLMWKILSFD